MNYNIYEINCLDEATLFLTTDDEDRAKQIRNLLYNEQDKNIKECGGEYNRYIIIPTLK